ncbi:serine/threonine protein kinase [Streptomyces sp. NBC_00663]|uniref:serine/threonine-protein kinase n=1 Tax=Streptomyces sp. NBC_00663 TaxID=2975801 RepID=UPI002E32AAC0|nr:serine/threonine-protein kinase [Streptomyces sp. NBC_00663]
MQPLGVDEPTAVGPYRLLGRLGSGGMGRVYLGRNTGGRTVAVKVVHPHFALDEEFRARFRREVEAARRVGGAWTAPVLDADPDAAVPWVATAYAAGPSLTAAVADDGPLPAPSVRALGAGLAEALAAVHQLGLVHRDVKPSNVLLTLDGPLLIDFGIARATDGTASLTSTGVSIGSPGYMSPEQILGKVVSGAADVFSLGAVLAYAANGESPFPGDSSAALLYKVVHEEPELGLLGGDLRELVAECLAKEPGARPSPGEVARRLAPEGAARLVAGGWLPGALVERVSRSAVQLLNLEVGGGSSGDSGALGTSGASGASGVGGSGGAVSGGAASGDAVSGGAVSGVAASGVVGFSSPVVGAPAVLPTVGEFGPPPVMPVAAPVVPVVPEPRDAVPVLSDTDVPRDHPGKLSVSVAATSVPGAGGRGRRLSCTVALAVAGALAAVTVGSVFLFDLLPKDDKDTNAGSSDAYSPQQTASSAPGESSGAEDTAPGGVPDRYLGTWEGQATGSGIPMGTFRLTVKEVAVGEQLGKLKQTDILGGVCNDVLTLKQVTKTELIATSVGAKSNHEGCNPAAHTVRLIPVGDDLKYVSESEAEGNPEARLSKVK